MENKIDYSKKIIKNKNLSFNFLLMWWKSMNGSYPIWETSNVPIVIEKWKKVSFFREKYARRICDTLKMEVTHPFLQELKTAFDNHLVSQKKRRRHYLKQFWIVY